MNGGNVRIVNPMLEVILTNDVVIHTPIRHIVCGCANEMNPLCSGSKFTCPRHKLKLLHTSD